MADTAIRRAASGRLIIPQSELWDTPRGGLPRHARVVGVGLEKETDDSERRIVIKYVEPVVGCPNCSGPAIGTTAWNSAHDTVFACKTGSCPVVRYSAPEADWQYPEWAEPEADSP